MTKKKPVAKGWRTVIWNVISFAAQFSAVAIYIVEMIDMTPKTLAIVLGILHAINIAGNLYLRSITDTAMGEAE